MIVKVCIKSLLKMMNWKKAYSFSSNGRKIVVYRRGSHACEVEYGKVFVLKIVYTTTDGKEEAFLTNGINPREVKDFINKVIIDKKEK